MSRIELHIGKLREINLDGKSIEEVAKCICKNENYKYVDENKSYLDVLLSIYPSKYFFVDNKLYEVVVDVEYEDDCADISTITKNEEGDYEYVMRFYNGGTCFSEMIESSLKDKNNIYGKF